MKTNEELYRLKEEYTDMNKRLLELTDDELIQVAAGFDPTELIDRIRRVTSQIVVTTEEDFMVHGNNGNNRIPFDDPTKHYKNVITCE